MKTYIISLNKPVKLINQLNDLGFATELFNGINGNTINLDTIKKHFNTYWFNIAPPSTLGCAMSHLSVWKKFLKTKKSHCLIVEDDVIFYKKNIQNINYNLYNDTINVLNYTPTDFDLLYLGCFDSTVFQYAMIILSNSGSFKKINKYINKPSVALATHSYIISRQGAKKLIKLLDHNINNHIDFCIQRLNKNKLLNVYSCNSKLIHQTSTDAGFNLSSKGGETPSSNVINKHPMLLQNVLSKIYINKHVTCDYLFTVSFMQIGPFTFNLTSILFLLLGIVFYKKNYSLLSLIFFIGSLPDLLSNNFKSTFLHYLLLISPKYLLD